MKNLSKKLLYLNLFLLQSYLIRFELFSYPSNLQEILIGINFLALLKEYKINEVYRTIKSSWILNILATLSIIFSGITILTVDYELISLIRNLKFIFFASILFIIFKTVTSDKAKQDIALKSASLGAIVFGLFSLAYNLLGHNLTHDFRLNGPLDSAVYLAFYLSPFFIYNCCSCIKKMNKNHLLAAITLALLLIGTRSMGAIAANISVVILYLLIQRKELILESKTTKFALTTIVITTSVLIFYTKILPTIQTEYSSLDERGQIWISTASLLSEPKKFLFGLGFGQFEAAYSSNAKEILGQAPLDPNNQHPHNIFLLFLVQYGILGLAFISYIAYLSIKQIKNPNIALFIVLYFFIHGLIDSPYFKNEITFLFILFLELALNYPSPETKSKSTA